MGIAHVSLDPEIFDGLLKLSRSTGVSVETLLEEACEKLLNEDCDDATDADAPAHEAGMKS